MAEERKAPPSGGGGSDAPEFIIIVIIILLVLAAGGLSFTQVTGGYENFLGYFKSKEFKDFIFWPMIIFVLFDVGLIAFIISMLLKFYKLEERAVEEVSKPPLHIVSPKKEVADSWSGIKGLESSSNPSDWNMAVIRADALLDDALVHLGVQGETIADRLKIVDPGTLKSIDRIWSAHRLRNLIAHDPMTQHTHESIANALRAFEDGLRELGMLE